MAFKTNVTGFSGTSVGGSGIEYAPGNSSPGSLSDRMQIVPLTVFFSFKKNSDASSGSGAQQAIYYHFSDFAGGVGSLSLAIIPSTRYMLLSWDNTGGSASLGMYYKQGESDAVIENGTWYDVCFSIDRSTNVGGSGIVQGAFGRSGTSEWFETTAPGSPFSNFNTAATYSTWLGCVGFDQWIDMSWDNVKIWETALTLNELNNERNKRLNRTANLHSWLPTIDTSNNSALINMSGNGKNWTNWINSGFQAPFMTTDSSPNGWGSSAYQATYLSTYYSYGYILGA